MIKFKDIFSLILESSRIQHAEDIIFWEGSKGAIRSVKSFLDLKKGNKSVSLKWDGSPAVIFGRNPEGKFVFTDKSGFYAKSYNGRPTSADEVEQMFKSRIKSSQSDSYNIFAKNMKQMYSIFESSVPSSYRGYFKGDLLYFTRPQIQEGRYVFTPNIVTYSVDVNSELGKKIGRSKAGVVIHRQVDELGNESSITNYGIFTGEELLVIPPVYVQKSIDIDEARVKSLLSYINKNAKLIDDFLDQSKLADMKMSGFADILYKYVNSKVDSGLSDLGTDFLNWLSSISLTQPMKKKISDYINNNKNAFDVLWKIVVEIMSLKNDIIDKIDNQQIDVKSYIGNVSGGEGYVFSDPKGDIKYVSRSKFTAANRAARKPSISEGGWLKPELTSGTKLTPYTLEKTSLQFKKFLNDLNNFLTSQSLDKISDYKILGSAGYYEKDKEEKSPVTYGDIDIMIVIPSEDGSDDASIKKMYIKQVLEFIKNSNQNYIDIESAIRSNGTQIVMKIDDDGWVQIDLLYTTKPLKDWFSTRFMPERGLKGFTMGGLYSALADVLNVRIGDVGVRAKFKDGKLTSPLLRKNTIEKIISTNPRTFLMDLAEFLSNLFNLEINYVDVNLKNHMGVDPNKVNLKDFATGIQGLAKTLDKNSVLNKLGFTYDSFISAIKNKYEEKMKEQYLKREKKANTPETQSSIEKIKKDAQIGLNIVNSVLNESTFIFEGGNAVNANSSLPREYLDSTIKHGLKLWKLGDLKYEVVGNKLKPLLGDIDVAVSVEQLEEKLGVSYDVDKKQFYLKLESYIKTNQPSDLPRPSYKVVSGLDQVHILVPIVDKNKNLVNSTTDPNSTGYVQIDLMIGDVGFMSKSLSGAPPESKYKAALRNILLSTILSYSVEPTNNKNVFKKYQINWKKGLQSVDIVIDADGKQTKQNLKTVYKNMDDVAKFLFGNNVTFENINTLEKLLNMVKSNGFRYKDKKNDILSDFKKQLEKYK